MKNRLLISCLTLALAILGGCDLGNGDGRAAIAANYETVNLCNKPVGKTFSWQNLQIQNPDTSWSNLKITNIEIRGDATCAFQVYRPAAEGEASDEIYPCGREEESNPNFKMVLAPGEVLILRIDYTPSAPGVLDRADLIISSNVGAPLAIPMCGMGLFVDAGTDGGLDAGLDAGPDAGPEEIPDAGSVECPQCGDALSADAPGCNNDA